MDISEETKSRLLQNLSSPFDGNLLGVKVADAERGKIIIEVEPKEEFTNGLGIIHGGVTASLCDTAMGGAAMTLGIIPVTVEMKINYISPAGTDNKLVGVGKVVKEGRTLIFTEGEIYYEDKLVAQSLGTYIVKNPNVASK
ncbi:MULTISPECIES: PaaI family thioesterase [Tepidanaerobacter]|uniref:PaaI family thioesterase n=1 Tax=Tepidanaerobacter TaxID=499228 RepID=UPI000AB5CF34|nr:MULTISPECIES: PaaI family thioesterase [Tepidanaerobacter]HHV82715.1 PaaI family thioesterase [Tepidanaerobacter syntrophicus]